MEKIRINKFIAKSGFSSRRKADKYIEDGSVKINGKIVTDFSTFVGENDFVIVNGDEVKLNNKKVYLILNKPKNVITSMKDEKNRKTVIDILKENNYFDRIFPVGRLDYDTHGILLMTNDGDLSYKLSHPSFGVYKTYRVTVNNNHKKNYKLENLLKNKSITVNNKKVEITSFKKIFSDNKIIKFDIKVHEGSYHMIKKIVAKIDLTLLDLERIEYSFLNLKNIKIGEVRELDKKEIERLENETFKRS